MARLAKVGAYGYTVSVMERPGRPTLYLRYRGTWESLGHADLDRAIDEAKVRAGTLLAARDAARGETLTLGQLFDLYTLSVKKSAKQTKEDGRRIRIWKHVLGEHSDPLQLKGHQLKSFERTRREGRLRVPGLALRAVRAKTVREDLALLRTVFRWAASMESGWLLERNPMDGYALPREINPRQLRAFYDDFLALQAVAPKVHRSFGPFLALLESLGWRVSAICQIKASDIDPERNELQPHGRLLKRAESDKVGVERWTVIPAPARAALDELLRETRRVGDQWLFPAERSPGPWTRHYARSLLLRGWKLAELPADRWPGLHGWRHKWATERKHLPRADVAYQGGWLSERTLDIYEAPDDESLLAVAEEPKKLRIGRKV